MRTLLEGPPTRSLAPGATARPRSSTRRGRSCSATPRPSCRPPDLRPVAERVRERNERNTDLYFQLEHPPALLRARLIGLRREWREFVGEMAGGSSTTTTVRRRLRSAGDITERLEAERRLDAASPTSRPPSPRWGAGVRGVAARRPRPRGGRARRDGAERQRADCRTVPAGGGRRCRWPAGRGRGPAGRAVGRDRRCAARRRSPSRRLERRDPNRRARCSARSRRRQWRPTSSARSSPWPTCSRPPTPACVPQQRIRHQALHDPTRHRQPRACR